MTQVWLPSTSMDMEQPQDWMGFDVFSHSKNWNLSSYSEDLCYVACKPLMKTYRKTVQACGCSMHVRRCITTTVRFQVHSFPSAAWIYNSNGTCMNEPKAWIVFLHLFPEWFACHMHSRDLCYTTFYCKLVLLHLIQELEKVAIVPF